MRADTVYNFEDFILNSLIDTTFTGTSFTPNTPLFPGKQYFWRVIINPQADSLISPLWDFETVFRDTTTTDTLRWR